MDEIYNTKTTTDIIIMSIMALLYIVVVALLTFVGFKIGAWLA